MLAEYDGLLDKKNLPEDTIARTANGKTIKKLVAEGLALSDGRETTRLNLGGIEGDRVRREAEAVGDEAGQLLVCQHRCQLNPHVSEHSYLTDSSSLLTENLLGVRSANDDIGDGGGNTHFHAGVTFLSQLALEELVELGVEDTVGDELAALGNVDAAHGLSGCGLGLHNGGVEVAL